MNDFGDLQHELDQLQAAVDRLSVAVDDFAVHVGHDEPYRSLAPESVHDMPAPTFSAVTPMAETGPDTTTVHPTLSGTPTPGPDTITTQMTLSGTPTPGPDTITTQMTLSGTPTPGPDTITTQMTLSGTPTPGPDTMTVQLTLPEPVDPSLPPGIYERPDGSQFVRMDATGMAAAMQAPFGDLDIFDPNPQPHQATAADLAHVQQLAAQNAVARHLLNQPPHPAASWVV